MRCCASVVERCKDTRGSTFLDEVANDLVVKIFDGCPLDLFFDVFFLFRLQSKLDKDLL